MLTRPKPGWSHTSAWYVFFFLFAGAHLPFWPLWLKDWGLSEAEVGAYSAAAIAMRVVLGVALPWIADRLNAPRRMLAVLALLMTALYAAHFWIDTRPILFAATLATAAVAAGMMPMADALSLRAAAQSGFGYATARSVGSAAFLAANLICGLAVARWGVDAALWWIILSFPPLILLGLRHPGGAGTPVGRPKLAEAWRLLKSPVFLAAMIAGAATQGSHAVLYAYGSIHWASQGIDDATIGALWALGVAVEVALMAIWGRALIDHLGAAGAILLAAGVGVFRWIIMTFDPSLIWLWPLQALHGLTFTAAHLGVMAFVQAAAPPQLAATAQGLTGALAGGVVMAGASFAAAWAYPAFGPNAYWIGATFAAVGALAAIALRRSWTGGALSVGG